ncbi:replicative DNA helicase [Caulobacter sp. Root343]|uniref:replicative DNA helicase n=1 Tax=Caulobacter sp. Root343 TaxID=1736520 RepID=UPI0007017EB0|nr:replicative DNA helicase [Caulobacter sp. Root343]KQV66622.1 replicative DNA helicase [Caulobacter sp. Root343]
MADGSQSFPAAVLPHNVQTEMALVGMLLADNQAVERIDWLTPAAFHDPFLERLFTRVVTTIRKGELVEPRLAHDWLVGDPAYEELGGLAYLAQLVEFAPPASMVVSYARQLRTLLRRREMIRIGNEMVLAAGQAIDEDEVDGELERAQQGLYNLAEHGDVRGGYVAFGDALRGAVEMVAKAYGSAGGVVGVSTGLSDIDQKLGGMHPSDLIVLAGRPSMGKTALATNIAFNVAKRYAYEVQPDGSRKTIQGGVVAFYSLEMSAEQLALRMLADASGVSGDRLRKGEINASEFGRVRDAAMEIQEAPLYIDATGGLSIAKLCARARRLKRQVGLDLVVVDYLQLVTGTDLGPNSNRVQEVSQITMALKALAKELGCPVIALSQLSRMVEQRADKRPMLSDLRESGSIEQDADIVAFVYREAYYAERTEPREGTPEHLEWQRLMEEVIGLAEVIIAKQRHGPIGTVKLAFDADTTKFSDIQNRRHQ